MGQDRKKKPTAQQKMRDIESLRNPAPVNFENQRRMLTAIKQAATQNFAELEEAVSSKPLNTVAWLSRNLLELALWSEYCHRSPFNAQNFMLDAGRDAVDALKVLKEMPGVPPAPGITRQELLARAREDGFTSIENRFTEVSDVAEFLGRVDHFKFWNKVLSKFAHPTAFALVTDFEQLESAFRRGFLTAATQWTNAVAHYADAVLAPSSATGTSPASEP